MILTFVKCHLVRATGMQLKTFLIPFDISSVIAAIQTHRELCSAIIRLYSL